MIAWLWIGFIALVLGMLALDLGVFNRKAHVFTVREALTWTGIWIVMAMLFNVLVYFMYEHHWLGIGQHADASLSGKDAALQFLTGYIVEKSLSMDNIFVIAVIFGYFKVPAQHQHRVLFWGIMGALIMRGIMIGVGAGLMQINWMIYVFGGILLVTAARMMVAGDEEPDPNHNWLMRLARRMYPFADDFDSNKFFTRVDGKRVGTRLLIVLIVVESTDVMFAVDSIPAIFGITKDPFIVFTSNIFAILGLRSLYFALAGMMNTFKYLKPSLVFILAFVGVKMLIHKAFPIPTWVSLTVIAGILAVGVLASIFSARRLARLAERMLPEEGEQTLWSSLDADLREKQQPDQPARE